MDSPLTCRRPAAVLLFLWFWAVIPGRAAGGFTFAVLADPRGHGDSFRNAMGMLAAGVRPEVVVLAGDMDPLPARHRDFLHAFPESSIRPVLLPVVGNHDIAAGPVSALYARDVLLSAAAGLVRADPRGCDYFLDHRNCRFIVVDAYSVLGREGVINERGLAFVERAITGAPAAVAHVFVAFHEPAFPRFRHVGDSFDHDRRRRNRFWRMLLRHRDRVRAVFVGHTHSYYRMRVADPQGKAANDPAAFPDEAGGIWQVDAGACGSGAVNTVVVARVRGREVRFRVLQAANGPGRPFRQVDAWRVGGPPQP